MGDPRLQSRRPHHLTVVRRSAPPPAAPPMAASDSLRRDADTISFDGSDETPTADLDVNDMPANCATPAHHRQPEQEGQNEAEASVPLAYVWSGSEPPAVTRPQQPSVDASERQSTQSDRQIAAAMQSTTTTPRVADHDAAPHDEHLPPVRPNDKAAPRASQPDITSGSVLRDRYLIEHVLGIGGNSVVFQAIDRHRDSVEGRWPTCRRQSLAASVAQQSLCTGAHAA